MPDAPPILSAEYVRKVAHLSRLALSHHEIELYRQQLSSILNYVGRLDSLDLTGFEPLAHVGDATIRSAEDTPGEVLDTQILMDLAPATSPPFLRVPKVFETGEQA
jgi:aspartyl-tRNA(Asn)/glutamyl-tRNA(Gln) amidotransferase subunit C